MHELLSRNSAIAAKCGVNAISRPCQSLPRGADAGLPFPQHPICQSAGEKIYIIDGDRAVLEEVEAMLGWIGTPIECFDNPFEFQKALGPIVTGCVIMDLRMPKFDGRSLHRWLISRNCVAPVIFLSAAADVSTAVECMRLGAHDFLSKPPQESQLSSAVVSAIAHSRMRFCQISSASKITDLLDLLTPAEKKVAELIAKGYLTKQIASILDRSENTIKIHRYRILNKVGVSSSAALVRMMSFTEDLDASGRKLPLGDVGV